jgi:predicted glycogen debranching enzyme
MRKVGDCVVTPRIGKPIEVNALWLNALVTMAQFARALSVRTDTYDFLAQRARDGFKRFWNESANYCFDVIDGPEPSDSSLRPNQILAVSLPECPLSEDQQPVPNPLPVRPRVDVAYRSNLIQLTNRVTPCPA